MRVSLERSGNGASASRSFTYQLVDDQLFTPLLAYVAMFNTLGSYERQFGATTFARLPCSAPRRPSQVR